MASNASELIAAGFGLGIAGAFFAIGVPYINAWFPKKERGFALGIYALGNGGTAISGLLTPTLAARIGQNETFLLVAGLLVLAGVLASRVASEGPGFKPNKSSPLKRLRDALAWKLTLRLALVYGLTFGAFITLGLYLPVLLHKSYGLGVEDAATRAAGFVIIATLIRPVGGYLSDRLNGVMVLRVAFFCLFILAAIAATRPPLAPLGTIAYLAQAAALGIGNGAVFAILAHRCPPKLVGTAAGFIGAAGGVGGYFPPIVLGISFQIFNSYSSALLIFAALCFILFWKMRRLMDAE
jgi:NNP family nitrate/nitrite transporter-like MFS transporter